MRIKLISPRVTMRPMDSLWKTHMSPPLSLLVLGALTPEEHEVWVEDENVERLDLNDRPDLVGITVKVDTVRRSEEIASAYRKRGIPVVTGGIHPTVCPEECAPFSTSVVVGEAEELWPRIITDAMDGALEPVYRNAGRMSIEKVPVPRWELIEGKNYMLTNTLRIGRGCPYRCDFCYNSSDNVDAGYRMKPVDAIVREIESLGIKHAMFIDDNFIGDPIRVRRLLQEFRALNLTWHAAVSADIGKHEDLLDQMAETGCKSLFIGFETVNKQNLLKNNKTQNRPESYEDTIRKIHERGMMVNASLVFGFDNDDLSVFPATLNWLLRNRVETMTAHILTPYPGTRLYRKLLAERRIIDTDPTHYNTAHAVFRPARMMPAELEEGYLWMYSQFYSWRNIFNRMPAAKSQLIAYFQFNLLYRKYGRATALLGKAVGMRNLAKLAKFVAYPPRKQLSVIGNMMSCLLPLRARREGRGTL